MKGSRCPSLIPERADIPLGNRRSEYSQEAVGPKLSRSFAARLVPGGFAWHAARATGPSRITIPYTLFANPYSVITRSTSSIEVCPWAALKMPSSLMVSMPSLRACACSSSPVAFFITNSLIVAVTGKTS